MAIFIYSKKTKRNIVDMQSLTFIDTPDREQVENDLTVEYLTNGNHLRPHLQQIVLGLAGDIPMKVTPKNNTYSQNAWVAIKLRYLAHDWNCRLDLQMSNDLASRHLAGGCFVTDTSWKHGSNIAGLDVVAREVSIIRTRLDLDILAAPVDILSVWTISSLKDAIDKYRKFVMLEVSIHDQFQ